MFLGTVHGQSAPKVYLFDEPVDMDNPIIINGNTLVPLRTLFEQLGATVSWNDAEKTVKATKGDILLSIQVGNTNVTKNGQTITLEEPAQIINDKTYVPLRFVAESFNQDVRWDKDNNAIYIGRAQSAKDISKAVAPSVVFIETQLLGGNGATGSGFIVDKSGIVVTNYHVIDYAKSITVKLIDGRKFDVAYVINFDADLDIAILKINSRDLLPVVQLGESDKIETGDKIFAIGSPKGLENTISEGIISNKSQMFLDRRHIQISVPIDHGSSGGALINTKGEVIGITDSGLLEADLNFAIPINDYKRMYKNNLNASLQQVFEYQHIVKYSDGSIYIGDKKNGVPNGIGIMTWSNGTEYRPFRYMQCFGNVI